MAETSLPPLIQQMCQPEFYPHPVTEPIRLLQTHVSYVLLTGDYAYKVKKPVNFGFLDYSTLEKRRHFCQEELRLNNRTAASLYLDAVTIHQDGERFHLEGGGGTRRIRRQNGAVSSRHPAQRPVRKGRVDRGANSRPGRNGSRLSPQGRDE
jgi:hypothetical protein